MIFYRSKLIAYRASLATLKELEWCVSLDEAISARDFNFNDVLPSSSRVPSFRRAVAPQVPRQ